MEIIKLGGHSRRLRDQADQNFWPNPSEINSKRVAAMKSFYEWLSECIYELSIKYQIVEPADEGIETSTTNTDKAKIDEPTPLKVLINRNEPIL
ncbi:6178_t:CDS:2 [Ambispora gerdemannii]|uniref:6178_t:CDS:1 n=1 Tax=Ambispora gerdemannii TaxID=144530 RepID=A0A9N9A3F4_9GLOM|nr:6178_t:CDS:2 [Ambispora gerdemannii]